MTLLLALAAISWAGPAKSVQPRLGVAPAAAAVRPAALQPMAAARPDVLPGEQGSTGRAEAAGVGGWVTPEQAAGGGRFLDEAFVRGEDRFGTIYFDGAGKTAAALAEAEKVRGPRRRLLSPGELARLTIVRETPSATLVRGSGRAVEVGYHAAAALVNRWSAAGEDWDSDKLRFIHAVLYGGTRISWWSGEYRTMMFPRARGTSLFFPQPSKVPLLLAQVERWYAANKRKLPPVVLAAVVYQRLVRIHPFTNGNGRSARLVMDSILQRHGYPPAVFADGDSDVVLRTTASAVELVARAVARAGKLLK